MKKIKRKIAFLLVAAMLLGMNLTAYAAVQQKVGTEIAGEEIGAELRRFLATENNLNTVEKGEETPILAVSDMIYDHDKYEYFNDEYHVYTIRADNFVLTGNTSPDTKLILNPLHDYGFFDSFKVQVGEDETAEELTVSCNLSFWGYYLKDKESGEVFRVTGDDRGELRSKKLKVAPKGDNGEDDKTDSFSLKRSLKADKSNISPGEEMPIRMNYEMVYDEGKYALYNGNDRWWSLGIADCTVSGNTCPGTRIEDREGYANTRYLVVDEEEKAEELTIEMTCGEWFYYVEDKTTNEIFPVSGGGGNPEILTVTVKIGGNSQDSQGSDSGSEPVKQGGSQQQGSQQQLPVEVRTDEVILANGEKLVSTVGGVYQTANVSGVAILTPKEQVESAAGIDTAGKNIRFYICDAQNTGVKKVLEQAAVQNGKNVRTAIHVDMYAISQKGEVEKLSHTSAKIRIVIGLPSQYRIKGKVYTIGMMGENGELQLLEDLDSDPTTVTIETDKFGVMALME